MTPKETFADRLQSLMERRGLGVAALARGCGVARQTVYNWIENDRIAPRSLEGLAAFLGVAPDWLRYGGTDKPLADDDHLALSTARQRYVHGLAESEQRLRLAARVAEMAVWELDLLSEEVRFFGQGLLDLPEDQACRLDVLFAKVAPEQRESLDDAIQRVLMQGGTDQRELAMETRGGERRWVEAWTRDLRDETGRIRGCVGVLQDVTDRIEARSALQRARDELERRVAERTEELTSTNANLRRESEERRRAETELRSERDRTRRYLEHAGMLVVVLDEDGRVRFANRRARALFETAGRPLEGREWFAAALPEAARDAARERFERLMAGGPGRDMQHETALTAVDGEPHQIAWRTTYLAASDGTPPHLLCVGEDVTERRTLERRMRLASLVVENTIEGVVVMQPDLSAAEANPAYTRISGLSRDEVVGRRPGFLDSEVIGRDKVEEIHAGLAADGQWRGTVWDRRKDGRPFLAWLVLTAIRDDGGGLVNLIATVSDITGQEDLGRHVGPLLLYDALTGLPNRDLLMDRLALALPQAARTGKHVAVLLIDVAFPSLTGTGAGRNVRDHLIRAVGERLHGSTRRGDTVARVHDERFALLLPDLPQATQGSAVVAKIAAALNEPFDLGFRRFEIAAGGGFALYPDHAATPQALVEAAESASVRARENGPGAYAGVEGPLSP